MYAYAHAPLDEETISLTSFFSGDKLYAFIRGFYGLKGLPNFFTKQMYSFFQKLMTKVLHWFTSMIFFFLPTPNLICLI